MCGANSLQWPEPPSVISDVVDRQALTAQTSAWQNCVIRARGRWPVFHQFSLVYLSLLFSLFEAGKHRGWFRSQEPHLVWIMHTPLLIMHLTA